MNSGVQTFLPVEAITTTRYRCPYCRRSWAHKAASVKHIERCWWNPTAQSCKTCVLYVPANDHCNRPGCDACGNDEQCMANIDLRPTLPVGCPKWEAKA